MRAVRLLVPLLLAGGLPGCVVVAAGAAGYGVAKYASNGDERSYSAPVARVTTAAVETLRAEGYPVAADLQPGPEGVTIGANDASVDVARAGEGITRVSVRVGTFQSEDHDRRARAILDGISRRLGLAPP